MMKRLVNIRVACPLIYLILAVGNAKAQNYSGGGYVVAYVVDANASVSGDLDGPSNSWVRQVSGRGGGGGRACIQNSLGALSTTVSSYARCDSDGSGGRWFGVGVAGAIFSTSWTDGVISGLTQTVTARLKATLRINVNINEVNGGGEFQPTSPEATWAITVRLNGPGYDFSRQFNGLKNSEGNETYSYNIRSDTLTLPVGSALNISVSGDVSVSSRGYGGGNLEPATYRGEIEVGFEPGYIDGLDSGATVLELPDGYTFSSPSMNIEDNTWQGPGPVTSFPTSVSVAAGEHFTGDLASLSNSDDNSYQVFNDPISLGAQVILNSTTTVLNPSDFKILYEGSVSRLGLAQSLSLMNFRTSTWTFVDGQVAPTTDQPIEVEVSSSLSDFVGYGGELALRINWEPINDEDPSQDGWVHSSDLAKWSLTQ